jgi:hypothetical protein
MAKIIPITEHFQHFLADLKESSGAMFTARRNWRGKVFWSRSRSGSEIVFRAGDGMNEGRGSGGIIATAELYADRRPPIATR